MASCLRYLHLLLVCLALLLPACGGADAPAAGYLTAIPDPKTLGQTYVSDPDHLLQPATVAGLNATLRALDQSGRAHIDVVLAQSIGGAVPKTAATELFNRWKIGDKTKNNGLLMLLVRDQHRMEFETGYGLEADLPDILCYRIQQQYMVPLMRARRYDEAVQAGVAAIIRQLRTGALGAAPRDSASQILDSPLNAATQQPEGSSPKAGVEDGAGTEPGRALPATAPKPSSPSTFAGIVAGVGGVVGVGLYLVLAALPVAIGRWQRWLLGLGALLPACIILLAIVGMAPDFSTVLLVAYVPPLLYLHIYFAVVNYRVFTHKAYPSRYAQHEYLVAAHQQMDFSAVVFPVLLALYWPWHRRRLALLRDAPYRCPTCGGLMHRLSEQEDDEHLALSQVAEELVKSIDYDVWRCDQCAQQLVFGYRNLASLATPCPECHNRTYLEKERQEVRAATVASGGWGWQHHKCEYCGYEHKEKFTTAQLSITSDSSSGSSSSSSSSDSSSSGGSSGGGGAGSDW